MYVWSQRCWNPFNAGSWADAPALCCIERECGGYSCACRCQGQSRQQRLGVWTVWGPECPSVFSRVFVVSHNERGQGARARAHTLTTNTHTHTHMCRHCLVAPPTFSCSHLRFNWNFVPKSLPQGENTPLHYAAKEWKAEAVAALINANANVEAQGSVTEWRNVISKNSLF